MAISRAIFFNIVLLLVAYTTCYNIEKDCRVSLGSNHECTADGTGYKYCDWFKRNILIKDCKSPKSKCRCFKNSWYLRECECVDPKPEPPFPETGIIRWHGKGNKRKTDWLDDTWVYEDATIGGEARKDKTGRYFMNETRAKFSAWTYVKPTLINEITIIEPNKDGSFTKYFRKGNNKTCSVENIEESKVLLDGWTIDARTWRYLWQMDSERVKKPGITTQIWKRGYRAEDHQWHWKWIVEYDANKNQATPKKFTAYADDEGSTFKLEKSFEYTPFNDEDDIGINIEDYCQ